jgi:ribonuclease HII
VALLSGIEQTALAIGVGIVPVEEIDAVGLGPANRIAMERSVLSIEDHIDALVIDACVLDLGCPQSGPIDGDALSLSVAAASIVAKVTRDRMMTDLSHAEPRYGFELHKGYCSELHKARLAELGPSPHHRRCFAPVAEWGSAPCPRPRARDSAPLGSDWLAASSNNRATRSSRQTGATPEANSISSCATGTYSCLSK